MELRGALPGIGLAVLLVADAGLVAWALRTPPAPAPHRIATSATASPTSSPSPSASVTAAEKASAAAVPLTRLVGAVDADTAWVAVAGTCTKAGSVALTTNGGGTWSSNAAPGRVTRLRPDSATEALAVGGADGCALTFWETTSKGETWSEAPASAQAWARDPKDATKVRAPGESQVVPCPDKGKVVDLSPEGTTNATVLCEGGELRTTSDTGATWKTALTQSGAVALWTAETGNGVLLARADKCAGIQVRTLVDGKAKDVACVAKAPFAEGRAAVSVAEGGAVWLVAGSTVWTAPAAKGPWAPAPTDLPG